MKSRWGPRLIGNDCGPAAVTSLSSNCTWVLKFDSHSGLYVYPDPVSHFSLLGPFYNSVLARSDSLKLRRVEQAGSLPSTGHGPCGSVLTLLSNQVAFPILNIFAPHVPQAPLVASLPFFIVTCCAFWISRLSRHFRQYPVIESSSQS